MRPPFPRRFVPVLLAAMLAVAAGLRDPAPTLAQDGSRQVTASARKYAFTPALIEVRHNDLVKVTLRAEDIAHSFTIDDYRIAKRAAAGQSTTFEFRADKVGTFVFYCNLRSDSGCRQMRGTLVVTP